MPKVSVIIPVYNQEKYLGKCLDSVVGQTLKDIEIICINDKSTDKSSGILEEYSKKDDRIIVINNEKNSGSAISRNRGLETAQGKYISFIDSDDYTDENFLESMYNQIEDKECDIVVNLSIIQDLNGNKTKFTQPNMPEINKDGTYIDKKTATESLPCCIWARLYKKSFIDKHSLFFSNLYSDDICYNAITSFLADKIFVFYGDNYYYRILEEGMVGRAKAGNYWDLEHMKAYNSVYDFFKERKILDSSLKLFRVMPFFKVDSQQKFDFYKEFFNKIKDDYKANIGIYNGMEKYFAESILSSESYAEYLKNYNKVVAMGFIQKNKS